MATKDSTAPTDNKRDDGEFMSGVIDHFYDLRALAMSARAMVSAADEDGEEQDALIRVLSCLEKMAAEFADEADLYSLCNRHASQTRVEVQHA